MDSACASIRKMAQLLEEFRDVPIQNVAAGEIVIEQGTNTGRLFILIEGEVEIVKDGEMVAVSKQPGDIFGDISALLNIPHTSSVRAVRDSRFHVVMEARPFLERNPVVCVHLCELLARRLVSVTEYLVNIKHQFAGHDHLGMVDQVLDSLLHRTPRKRIASRSATVHLPEITD